MNIRASSTFRPGAISAIQARITPRVVAAVTKATSAVLASALEKVPVDTGELQSSGHMLVTLEGDQVVGRVIFDAPHAAFVEFGTGIRGSASPGRGTGIAYSATWSGMPAQPYVRPAIDENQDTIVGCFRDEGFNV